MDENDPKYYRAKERVAKVRSFYASLSSYILVNIILIIINLLADPQNLWFYWVTLIWGVVLIFQGITTFSTSQMLGDDWEKRKIKKYMEKDKKSNDHQDE